MNRGSFELCIFHASLLRASMRPRFMNRGSDRGGGFPSGLRFASMRPRFMNRGSRPLVHVHQGDPRRFNEAPIHESGKCGLL